MIKSKNKKNILIQLSSIFIVIVFFFSASFPVQAVYLEDPNAGANAPSIKEQAAAAAKVVLDPVGEALHAVVVLILKAILEFLGLLLSAAASILQWILKAENVHQTVGNPIVYDIWSKVRDVLNIAFILGLLFSAFCTVFQVSKFSYKNMLFNLILMALLVNFSFPIARIIIDFSNVIMYYLLNALDIGNFVTRITENNPLNGVVNQPSPSISYLIAAIIFTFIFAITLLVLAILFIIRLVALTFLVIFSPIAFVGSIIPFLSNKASSWWDSLFKYCFFGPVMIFMMYVAIEMIVKAKAFWQVSSSQIVNNQTNDPGIVAAIAFFSVPIVILWGGMGVAQSMSITGAGMVTGKAQGFIKGTGKWMGKKVDRGLANRGKSKYRAVRALQYFSPTALKTAWKQKEEEENRKAFVPATGAWRDKLNKYWTLNPKKFGRDQSRHKEASFQANIAQKQKELESVTTNAEYMVDEFNKAKSSKDTEKMAAVLRIMFNNNDQNEFMKLNGQVVDPDHMREYIYEQLTKAGMSEEQAAKQLSDLGEVAFGKGNFANFSMGYFDPKKGNYVKADSATQAANAVGKTTNMKAQTLTDLWHWNSFLQQNADSSSGDLHNIGKAQLDSITMLHINQMGRLRPDFVNRLYEKISQIKDYANSIRRANPTQAAIIDKFASHIERMKTDPSFKP